MNTFGKNAAENAADKKDGKTLSTTSVVVGAVAVIALGIGAVVGIGGVISLASNSNDAAEGVISETSVKVPETLDTESPDADTDYDAVEVYEGEDEPWAHSQTFGFGVWNTESKPMTYSFSVVDETTGEIVWSEDEMFVLSNDGAWQQTTIHTAYDADEADDPAAVSAHDYTLTITWENGDTTERTFSGDDWVPVFFDHSDEYYADNLSADEYWDGSEWLTWSDILDKHTTPLD